MTKPVHNGASQESSMGSLVLMSFTHFANHVYVQVHLALIPVFMKEFGLSLAMIGILLMIPILCEAIMTIPAGLVADRVGHMKQIVLSMILTASGAALMTQAVNVYFVVISLCILALSTTVYHPPAYGATSEMFTTRRTTALGVFGAGGTLGWALGPLSVGLFLSLGWRFVYVFWIFPILISIPFLLRMMKAESVKAPSEPSKRQSGSFRDVLTLTYATVLLMIAVNQFGRQIVTTFMSPYMVLERGLDVATASYLIGAMSLAGLVGAPVGGFLADKFGGKRYLTLSYAASIVAFLGFLFSTSVEWLFLTGFAYQLCVYSGMGANSALTARFTPKSRRGTGYALYFLPSYVAGAVAPVTGGFISQSWGIGIAFLFGIVGLVVSIGILQLIPKD